MKSKGTYLLAALAAAALWTLGLAGTASATELFEGAKTLESGTTVHASLTGSTTLESTEGTLVDTCTGGALEGATTNTGKKGEDVGLEVVSLTWSGCSFTTDTLATGNLAIKWTSGLNGTVTGSGMTWTVKYAVDCRYGTGSSTALGTVTGKSKTSEYATIDINAALAEQEPKSAFCPDSVNWKASYTVTSPTGLNVADGTGGGGEENTELFEGGTTLEKEAALNLTLTSGSSALQSDTSGELADTCKGSTVGGNTTSTTAGEITLAIETLDWSSCTWTTTTLAKGSLDIKYVGDINGDGQGDGTVTGTGTEVTNQVFGFLDCVYGTGAGTHLGTLTGSAAGHATISINAMIKLVSGAFCPETTKWVASYTVTSPTGLNVRQ